MTQSHLRRSQQAALLGFSGGEAQTFSSLPDHLLPQKDLCQGWCSPWLVSKARLALQAELVSPAIPRWVTCVLHGHPVLTPPPLLV